MKIKTKMKEEKESLEFAIDLIIKNYDVPKKDILLTYEENKKKNPNYDVMDLIRDYKTSWLI